MTDVIEKTARLLGERIHGPWEELDDGLRKPLLEDAAALGAAGLLAAPLVSPDEQVEDLTARLAAADIAWSREIGDTPHEPPFIQWLAEKACAFMPALAAPAQPDRAALLDAIAAVREPQEFESGGAPHRPDLLNFAWMARRLASIAEFYASAPAPADDEAVDGVALIAAERRRQVDVEGWTAEHDDQHRHCELLDASRCYANQGRTWFPVFTHQYGTDPGAMLDQNWPWWVGEEPEGWKPSRDPITDLAKAGALIAAEIDRLQRTALAALGEEQR